MERSAETTRDDPDGEYLKRNRWFESGSLQRRVFCELPSARQRPRRRNDLTRQSFVLVRFNHLDLIPVTRSRTAQRPAGATDHRSRKTEREVFQPQPPCDEGLVVAIFSRLKTRAAFLDIRPRQPGSGFARPRVSLSGHA